MNDLEQKLLADVDAILGPGGLITRLESDLGYRAQQHQYARRAASGFARFDVANGKTAINMLQAATGTGKTMGYLVPLMLYAAYGKGTVSRVAISTFTRALQKQILSKDAQVAARLVAEHTGTQLSIGLRMGISNFASPSAAARLRDALDRQPGGHFDEAIEFLDDLIDWVGAVDRDGKRKHSGLISDFVEEHELGRLPFGVTADAVALDHTSPDDEKVAYQALVKASKEVDVLVVNHALLVTNAMRWSALLDDADKRPIAALVCDEADQLATAAESVTGAGLSLHRLMAVCSSLGDEKAVAVSSQLLEFARNLKASDAMQAIDDRSDLAARMRAALQILRPIGAACADALQYGAAESAERPKQATFLDALQQIEAIAEAIADLESSAIISWSPVREYPSLRVGRPYPGRVLSRLWNLRRDPENLSLPPQRGYCDAVLMTSATLETPGRDLPRAFDDFAASVGVVRHLSKGGSESVHNVTTDLFARFEPGSFGAMQFVLADPSSPLPSLRNEDEDSWDTSPEWLDYAANMVRAAHEAGHRTLVLALSWKDVAEIGRRLHGMDGLIVHQRGQAIQEVRDQYVATPNAVLLTPSAWEGVDLPGMVQQLVITRIPYAPADNALDAHRTIHYEYLGYSSDKVQAILHGERESATRRKMAQGLGRGIRRHDDSVTIWIADPRFPLPENFADSLDPIMMNAPARRSRPMLRFCIPERFRESTYPQAQIFLASGQRYTLSDL